MASLNTKLNGIFQYDKPVADPQPPASVYDTITISRQLLARAERDSPRLERAQVIQDLINQNIKPDQCAFQFTDATYDFKRMRMTDTLSTYAIVDPFGYSIAPPRWPEEKPKNSATITDLAGSKLVVRLSES